MPKVSVILPVYNGVPYLNDAIGSILNQSFTDFELIIINDGSIDDSELAIKSFYDSRIRFYNQDNRGLVFTLNRLIELSTGQYIARQDADDVSFSTRIQKQVDFLDANPDVGMVGTYAEIWHENHKTNRTHKHPVDNSSIKFHLLFDNPFVHTSVMMRRSVLVDVGFYLAGQGKGFPEDYELWSRISRKYKLANIAEELVAYREVEGSLSRTGENPFLLHLVKISSDNIAYENKLNYQDEIVVSLASLVHGVYDKNSNIASIRQIRVMLKKMYLNIKTSSSSSSKDFILLFKEKDILLCTNYVDYVVRKCFLGTIIGEKIRLIVPVIKRILLLIYR